ncbi:hypothetical protein KL933_000928 [Ogataea haglerorum]|uniref:GPI-anchor transamidase n=1 Tax=Ogataea haglerorum TaxID=1937702 RepID=A0AAN6I2L3_9ASCO|nr:uncharacterized protein KL911_001588 [Ogataea haglerorum]KAG7708205.1 hypothetical protein KL914_001931 [Ogataea haglerorum]KAG7729848.1 hypothetical protein KL933_000928 [Ogataea haglerorum]KAG7732724.1 hypothetical protein KL948_002154 [Ogataea haglerorum]KAG7740080.1 hypothetical protein KL923_001921 [Ogataea haglerorum]KAG7755531.1 hypothetical protein KL911_001588 [Ogataea haglerorum]
MMRVLKILWSAFVLASCLALNTTEPRHTNNWAVLVSTSRFWFNYRHMANVLSMYRTVKRLGIPDSQIILMLSDDIACNPRNAFPGFVFNNADRQLELYGDNIEVDYRGYEVTVENFIRLLTDRWPDEQPKSKRLLTDEHSNIFIYMTGHGGDEFLKFQDAEEISSYDIADAFEEMHEKKRYNEIFFMIDTCQANTMYSKFYSPNILAVGSSDLHESSYSHHSDTEIGVAVIDRFTYFNLEFLENLEKDSKLTLQDLVDSYTFEKIHSNAGVRTDLFQRNLSEVLITDFFGNVQQTVLDNVEEDLLYLTNHDAQGFLKNLSAPKLLEVEEQRKPSYFNQNKSMITLGTCESKQISSTNLVTTGAVIAALFFFVNYFKI